MILFVFKPVHGYIIVMKSFTTHEGILLLNKKVPHPCHTTHSGGGERFQKNPSSENTAKVKTGRLPETDA